MKDAIINICVNTSMSMTTEKTSSTDQDCVMCLKALDKSSRCPLTWDCVKDLFPMSRTNFDILLYTI